MKNKTVGRKQNSRGAAICDPQGISEQVDRGEGIVGIKGDRFCSFFFFPFHGLFGLSTHAA